MFFLKEFICLKVCMKKKKKKSVHENTCEAVFFSYHASSNLYLLFMPGLMVSVNLLFIQL